MRFLQFCFFLTNRLLTGRILDNAHIAQSRLILLDATLIFFLALTIYSYIRFRKLRYRYIHFCYSVWFRIDQRIGNILQNGGFGLSLRASSWLARGAQKSMAFLPSSLLELLSSLTCGMCLISRRVTRWCAFINSFFEPAGFDHSSRITLQGTWLQEQSDLFSCHSLSIFPFSTSTSRSSQRLVLVIPS